MRATRAGRRQCLWFLNQRLVEGEKGTTRLCLFVLLLLLLSAWRSRARRDGMLLFNTTRSTSGQHNNMES